MTDTFEAEPQVTRPSLKRTRERKSSLRVKRKEIVSRILKFERDDRTARSADIEGRIQRYAKYRMWTEGKDFPWPDSSDAAIPDMFTSSASCSRGTVNSGSP